MSEGIPVILVVDDDPLVRESHRKVLERASFSVETASDGLEALSKLALGVDLVVLDGEMPHMDGFEVASRIREDPRNDILPIIMVTGLFGRGEQRRAMEVGIDDFVTKPVDPPLLEFRCRWLVERKRSFDAVRGENRNLRESVEGTTENLRKALEEMTEARRSTFAAHLDTIRRLTLAAEYKDADTAGHIERIGRFSQIVGRSMGLAPGRAERLLHAAPMHDVGKIAIPDRVLLKAGELDEHEWTIMRSHTTTGARLLSNSPSPILQLGETIALTHHERWDGTGYPHRLQRDEIPLEGRICAVVDFFDALTMDRPYRSAFPVPKVLEMMQEQSSRHFDPDVLEAFMGSLPDIEHARQESLTASATGR